ncbi:hypothetical protein NESM_000415000 [Novymonas esmeraldas]|uniref:Uncharacterized protein n=1 Tax=Novymonas esmeraldas TaxID=1808958 RepID=A0AAW0ELL5_9TRYP
MGSSAPAPPRGWDTAAETTAAVAVFVRRPALLDVKPELVRPNPSFLTTCFSTLLTALLLGLCFVIVGIPPLYLTDWHGRVVYVAIMVPMLTVLGTVLSYYAMQHPQRLFNAAVAQMVREMEQHAAYLSTAVSNVEAELELRGVNLSSVTAGDYARGRSLPVTPEDQALHRVPGTSPAANSHGFLRGIDAIDEDRDITVATVHVGREWRWLMGILGKLGLRSLTGPTNPMMHCQRATVRALAISVARVERMILSLYFSSFVLHRANALAPLNPWAPAAVSGAAFGNAASAHRSLPHTRFAAAAPPFHPSAPVSATVKLHEPHTPGHEPGGSLTESAFTIPRGTPRDSKVVEDGGTGGGGGGGETASLLTSPNGKEFIFGKRVKLPQFPPLLGSSSGAGGRAKEQRGGATHADPAVAVVAAAAPQQTAVDGKSGAAPCPDGSFGSLADTHELGVHVGHHDGHGSDGTSSALHNRHGKSATIAPSTSHRTTLRRQSNGAVAEYGESDATVFSPRSVATTQQPGLLIASASVTADGTTRPPTVATGASKEASPTSSQPPKAVPLLLSPPPLPVRRRQPGTAVVAAPTSLMLHRGTRFIGDENDVVATVLVHVRKGGVTRYSRLYGVLAHTSHDAAAAQYYFTNGADSTVMRNGSLHQHDQQHRPFSYFYVSDHDGERQGLTILEQRLLQCAYCRPEESEQLDADGHPRATDLSSLAVRGDEQEVGADAASQIPSSAPHRTSTGVYAEQQQRVDSFVIALQLLANRPMRLAFLSLQVEPAHWRGTSLSHSSTSLSSLGTPPRGLRNGGGSEDGAGPAVQAAAPPPPPPKTVPVLECVVDDVLCILTRVEITVEGSLQQPQRVLLVGVSLEDVSDGVSERGDLDVDDGDDEHASTVASTASRSLEVGGGTRRPAEVRATPKRAAGEMANPPGSAVSASAPSLPPRDAGAHCTLGQEFREVIQLQ